MAIFPQRAENSSSPTPLRPPRAQINFLWNDTLISGLNQFGAGEGVFNNQTLTLNHAQGRVRLIADGRRFFYLRDMDSGRFWSTGLRPAEGRAARLRTTVGLGYSQFELTCEGIVCTSRVMLAPDEPVEVWTFRVRNTTSRRRRLWLVPYIEWLLGGYATFSSPYSYLRSTFDPALRAVLRDEGLACEMEQRATAISAAIEQHGWDGRWYLAGYSDAGRPVGSAENREGRLYLNPQTWAVMTGLAQGVRRRACLRANDGMLESRHGSLTLWPPYTKRDEHVGRVTMLLPGMYENGTPYCHGTAFKIVADLCAGRADHALASFLKVMPDHPDHPSTVSGCEPYAFTNQYLGPHHGRAGASISGWITGTAAWMFRAVWEYFPGIRPDYDGFLVRPCLPAAWSEVRAVRKIRGTSHAFRLVRTTSGVDVEVDGRKLAGDFVPYGC